MWSRASRSPAIPPIRKAWPPPSHGASPTPTRSAPWVSAAGAWSSRLGTTRRSSRPCLSSLIARGSECDSHFDVAERWERDGATGCRRLARGSDHMNGAPTTAIAIPAYNAATTIGKALKALQANAALSRIALVAMLDDCSQDQTAEVARAHWQSPVPFEVWRNPENMGQWQTTNALIARVADRIEPEWTFILHADDV